MKPISSYGRSWPAAEAEQLHVPARLRRMRAFARWLDAAFRIPGTKITVGLDSLVGLIPGLGDAFTAAASVYIVVEARRLGLPKRKIFRMVYYVLLDLLVGAVPVLGDFFDVAFKANMRNVAIVEEHFEQMRRRHR